MKKSAVWGAGSVGSPCSACLVGGGIVFCIVAPTTLTLLAGVLSQWLLLIIEVTLPGKDTDRVAGCLLRYLGSVIATNFAHRALMRRVLLVYAVL